MLAVPATTVAAAAARASNSGRRLVKNRDVAGSCAGAGADVSAVC
jgi:hypothetical protein